mgnify:CR=1 FL=1
MYQWTFLFLAVIIAAVLLLPFSVKRVEEELEAFLLVMGAAAMTVSGAWSWHITAEALKEPLPIAGAVLAAGLIFAALRPRMERLTEKCAASLGTRMTLFVLIAAAGLAASAITAIVAALLFCELLWHLKLDRSTSLRASIYACYAIGLGAALTPLGEPLSTIITSKLRGAPHNAGFFWLAGLLAYWVIPAILAAAAMAAFWKKPSQAKPGETAAETAAETPRSIGLRALKVYVFIAALVLLGEGLRPLAEAIIPKLGDWQLYLLGLSSAALDNATLASAGIVPAMSRGQILSFALSLLVSGGMLIPGNIPNIITASKLGIRSKEWARTAIPPGILLLGVYFALIRLLR